MTLSMWFWIGMAAWLLLGLNGWWRRPAPDRDNWGLGGFLLQWALIALIGWQAFGGFVKG